LDTLHLAFSREKDNLYVQDLITQQPELVIRLLQREQGCLYICGNTKMGLDVQSSVKAIVGDAYFKQMQAEKRIIVELWSS
jgi:sulfite reductase alpha subunit-like flavoprotein